FIDTLLKYNNKPQIMSNYITSSREKLYITSIFKYKMLEIRKKKYRMSRYYKKIIKMIKKNHNSDYWFNQCQCVLQYNSSCSKYVIIIKNPTEIISVFIWLKLLIGKLKKINSILI